MAPWSSIGIPCRLGSLEEPLDGRVLNGYEDGSLARALLPKMDLDGETDIETSDNGEGFAHVRLDDGPCGLRSPP